jgi:hypothetical protein
VSRFANVAATRTVQLGPCECPGTPHDGDWFSLRTDLSGPEVAALLRLDTLSESEQSEAVVPFVTEWNLRDDDGDAVITPEALFALKGPTLKAIGEALGEVLRENLQLPNRSSAPSRASSRGSASRTRTSNRKPGT